MARPTLSVLAYLGSSPLGTPGPYDNLSSRVLAFGYQRGRNRKLNQADVGGAYITLDNRDNALDPANTASPYYGTGSKMEPFKRVSIQATWASTTYDLFTGFIESWQPDYPTTRIDLFDPLRILSNRTATITQPAGGIDAAFRNAADTAGWPTSIGRTAGGTLSTVPATSATSRNVLSYMQAMADTEQGIVFCRGNGLLWFQGRQTRYDAVTYASFSDDPTDIAGGYLPYTDAPHVYDDSEIYNAITLTREGGVAQNAQDGGSISNYSTRALSKSGLLHATDSDTADLASYLLSRYKLPKLRIDQLTIDGELSDSLWPHLLGREISDRITVRKRPFPTRTLLEQDSFIEGVRVAVDRNRWRLTWNLSRVDAYDAWRLDYDTLDTDTFAAY